MIRLLTILSILIVAGWQFAHASDTLSQDPQSLFLAGNEAYQQKDYLTAIGSYEGILEQGLEHPELYYNLGNAYYRNGNLAPAILNYERALRLSPGNEDIKFNLELARIRVVDKVEAKPEFILVSRFREIRQSISSDNWAALSILLIAIALFLGLLFIVTKSAALKRFSFFGGLLFLMISLFTLLYSYKQFSCEIDSGAGVIFASNSYVKSEPDNQSTDLFIIHEGLKVEILDEEGDWVRIRLADGQSGWIPLSDLEQI